ncbi:ParB/RepB/Spo0J family partition protein [Anaeromyxobacter paludicola]|uniref:ParB-like N-terminal domain-containing protein n=1 Tax=Anaeromyxobacter paludicola TaxID=2918171 RepID=A0ABM7X9Y7_9BACT|nr:ParB/RepB/Spo0J family partition protein [Anaeromyxobacter paludicola]BDG08657.1 hypothetical protein AMPC_17700 [Anaeromyxobacter paludicola]
MTDRMNGKKSDNPAAHEALRVAAPPSTRAGLATAAAEAVAVLREIPLDAIEPDPAQPRRAFDEESLQRLAVSITRYGLLQEPGVTPVDGAGAGESSRYRLLWGERRWRASRLAGLATIRCKVLPPLQGGVTDELRAREKQWAENMEREGLSPIEEAIALQDAADRERQLSPDRPMGELIEKVGAERGLNGIVARNLVGLLKAPRCLQAALLRRAVRREMGFELARHWNKLLAENELRGAAKREIQYRNLVEAWARARELELDASAMARYAAETYQDPKVVRATCRKAEEAQKALIEHFEEVVTRAEKEGWSVARARAALADRRRKHTDGKGGGGTPCFERTGREKTRLVVHLDRVRDPAVATPEAVAELLTVLRGVVREIEATQLGAAAAPERAG